MDTLSTFEILPDEILLNICRYLQIGDVLYSFYNLNARLNVSITGYCRHLNIRGLPYRQYNYVVSNILPQLAPFIQSFAFHYYRDMLWSSQAIALFDIPHISSLFPRIRKIILYEFTSETLSSFMNKLQDLSELKELVIRDINGTVGKILLDALFTANNHRLNSIVFEPFTVAFDIPELNYPYIYENIQKLVINLKSNQQLRQFLCFIPNIQYLYVIINSTDNDTSTEQTIVRVPTLVYLRDFRLSSIKYWDLNEIGCVLQDMPSLQNLLLDISTTDEKVINQEHFLAKIPSSLQQIHFMIRYTFSELPLEVNSLVSAWSDSLPISCFLNEDDGYLLMFTNHPGMELLDLPASIGKQISQTCQFMKSVNDLFIYDATSLADIFSTLKHFSCLQKLEIKARDFSEFCTKAVNPSIPLNLIHLQRLKISGKCGSSLFDIIKTARNLDNLALDFDYLKIVIDDEPIRDLFQQRITRLKIRYDEDIEFDSFQHVIQMFDCLRYLSVTIKDANASLQQSLSIILAAGNIKQLTSLVFKTENMNEINLDRQWIIDHSALTSNDQFVVDISDGWFTLWK